MRERQLAPKQRLVFAIQFQPGRSASASELLTWFSACGDPPSVWGDESDLFPIKMCSLRGVRRGQATDTAHLESISSCQHLPVMAAWHTGPARGTNGLAGAMEGRGTAGQVQGASLGAITSEAIERESDLGSPLLPALTIGTMTYSK